MNDSKWFAEAKFGLFIHWGLYALMGRGEWAMKRDGIPAEEYNELAKDWDPEENPAEKWCRLAAECGMKYAVFTTRHHDGFSLFDTKSDPFNSMNAPCHRDFVAEFTTACRKYGLKVGLYYSLVDWRLQNTPARIREQDWIQLRELMTNYGRIDLLWYDGSWHPEGMTTTEFYDSENLNNMIRSLQPEILINDRSGIKGDFADLEGRNIIRRPEGAKLWELCMTMGDDDFSYWGYCRHSVFQKTPEQCLLLLLHTMEFGGNLLLNVSPDSKGNIPDWQINNLKGMGRWIAKHAYEVYGTEQTEIARKDPLGWQGNSCCFFTRRNDEMFCYLYTWPGTELRLNFFDAKICSISFEGKELPFKQYDDGHVIVSGLSSEPPDDWCPVLRFTIHDNK